jgi:hypothetical protein
MATLTETWASGALAGSSSSSATERDSERLNVTDALQWTFPEDYGAVSDGGTTDNAAALQAWIDGTTRGRGIVGDRR